MSTTVLVLSALGLFAGAAVKGIAGIGMPLVAVPLLTVMVDLKTAVTMTTLPVVASNLAQSFQGRRLPHILRRFWPLLVPLFICTVFGTRLLVELPLHLLDVIIGIAVITVPIIIHFFPRLTVTPSHERWGNPLVGIVAGLLGGMSTFYGPPLMLYLFGMRLAKDDFIPAISVIYLTAGVAMMLGIWLNGVATVSEIALSGLMLIPTALGMYLGRFVRMQLTEHRFRQVLIALYIATGITFLVHAAL